jgi:protein phosphatase 2C
METLHFFGVFDGHGGAEAALHCAQTLHQRIAEALAAATEPMPVGSTGLAEDGDIPLTGPSEVVTLPDGRSAVLRPVNRPSEDEISADADDLNEQLMEDAPAEAMPAADGVACSSASFESALTSAFNRTDEEFGKADNAALVGTTAVVTLVGSRQLYVANCGDSRAVLCRAGQAIPLTDDHKAAREDETARVEAAGGQILFWNGVRVMGVLAVSRAIGDHCLRPYVIAQPEVTILARRPDDELLLLASDGLWDVLSNQEACTLAKRCLRRARQRHASRQSAARIAATVLTRAAVDRGSRDNVTVLVVDLSNGAAGAAESDAAPLDRGSSTMLGDEVAQGEQDADEGLTSARSQGLPPRA